MSLSRDAVVKLNQYLDFYTFIINKEAETFKGKFSNAASYLIGRNNASSNKAICDELRKEINNAKTDVHWINILVKLGETADTIQNDTINHSKCCETLHVMRRIILDEIAHAKNQLQNHSLAHELDKKIASIRAKLAKEYQNRIDVKKSNQSLQTRGGVEQEILKYGKIITYLGCNNFLFESADPTIREMFPDGMGLKKGYEYSDSSLAYNCNVITSFPLIAQENFLEIFNHKYREELKKSLDKQVEESAIIEATRKQEQQEEKSDTTSTTPIRSTSQLMHRLNGILNGTPETSVSASPSPHTVPENVMAQPHARQESDAEFTEQPDNSTWTLGHQR